MGHFALNQAISRPDYGWCWVIFASSCLLNFVQSGFCNSFGVLFAHLLKEMGEQEERIAWIGSIALCFNMLGALPAVKLCDKIGIPCTWFAGTLLCSCGFIGTSFARNKEGAKKAAEIRRRPGGSTSEKVPLLSDCHTAAMYTQTEVSAESTSTLRKKDEDDVTCTKPGRPTATNRDKFYQQTLRLLKRKEYLLFLAIMIITNFTYYIPLTHLINYAEKFGTSSSKATLLITIWSACHVVGCAAFALIATRYPTKRLLTYQVAMLVSGIASILTSVADKYSLLVAYSIVHGFLDGSFSGLQPIVTLDVVGRDDMDRGFGILNCMIAIPCSLGPAVVGWVNDSKILPRRSMFYFAGVPFVAGSILMTPLIQWVPFTTSKPPKTSESCPQSSASTDAKV